MIKKIDFINECILIMKNIFGKNIFGKNKMNAMHEIIKKRILESHISLDQLKKQVNGHKMNKKPNQRISNQGTSNQGTSNQEKNTSSKPIVQSKQTNLNKPNPTQLKPTQTNPTQTKSNQFKSNQIDQKLEKLKQYKKEEGKIVRVFRNELQNNELQNNELQINQIPNDQIPNNELPSNELPNNELQINELPNNELPNNELQINQIPSNELQNNELQINEPPFDQTIIMTVGNFGYLRLILNWYRSIQKNTNMVSNCCLVTYDRKLIDHVRQQIPQLKTIYLEFLKPNRSKTDSLKSNQSKIDQSKIDSLQKPIVLQNDAVSYKNAGWDEITLYKLYAIHYLLMQNKTVYYIDPDVYVLRDSLQLFREIMGNNPQYRMLIQQGKPFCSGVMYVPPNPITLKLFDPREWQMCGTDDEKYIIEYFTHRYPTERQYVGVLDLDRFPNGLKWRMNYTPDDVQKQITVQSIDLLHFNYISGIENKIMKMQEYGMYLKTMKIINIPAQFLVNINEVCMNKNHIVYPPHQTGDQIELFAYKYICERNTKCEIFTEYDYLPIQWTAIAVENNPKIIKQLKEWLRDFCKKNPQRKCWTIVQHCKGIEIALDIRLPSDWIVFATSDPNALKTLNVNKNKSSNNKQNKINQKTINQINTSNHIIIPLLSSNHIESKDLYNREILASFIGDIHVHPIREKMVDVINDPKTNNLKTNNLKTNNLKTNNLKTIVVCGGNYRNEADQNKFKELMQKSVFALCPRGYGNTSYRIVEAMQFGAIPVYISDVFSLPYCDPSYNNNDNNNNDWNNVNWNSIAVLINENEIDELVEILRSKTDEQIAEYRANLAKIYEKYFTMQGCCEYMLKRIVS